MLKSSKKELIEITKIITYIRRTNYPLYLEIIKNDYIKPSRVEFSQHI